MVRVISNLFCTLMSCCGDQDSLAPSDPVRTARANVKERIPLSAVSTITSNGVKCLLFRSFRFGIISFKHASRSLISLRAKAIMLGQRFRKIRGKVDNTFTGSRSSCRGSKLQQGLRQKLTKGPMTSKLAVTNGNSYQSTMNRACLITLHLKPK